MKIIVLMIYVLHGTIYLAENTAADDLYCFRCLSILGVCSRESMALKNCKSHSIDLNFSLRLDISAISIEFDFAKILQGCDDDCICSKLTWELAGIVEPSSSTKFELVDSIDTTLQIRNCMTRTNAEKLKLLEENIKKDDKKDTSNKPPLKMSFCEDNSCNAGDKKSFLFVSAFILCSLIVLR